MTIIIVVQPHFIAISVYQLFSSPPISLYPEEQAQQTKAQKEKEKEEEEEEEEEERVFRLLNE